MYLGGSRSRNRCDKLSGGRDRVSKKKNKSWGIMSIWLEEIIKK